MRGFTPSAAATSWCECRPARTRDESWLLRTLEGRPVREILELGSGTGDRAASLLRQYPAADYRGFEPSPDLQKASAAALAIFAERASVEGRNLALQLPLPDAGHDLVLILDLLEFLRMDQLYMTLAEARRTLRPRGICALRTLSFAPGVRGSVAAALFTRAYRLFPSLTGGCRPLELNHYISPEDWRVLSDERAPAGWLTRQTVVLERL